MRNLRRVVILVIVFLALSAVQDLFAAEKNSLTAIVYSRDVHKEVYLALSKHAPERYVYIPVEKLHDEVAISSYISLDSRALTQMIQSNINKPIFSLFTTRNQYEEIIGTRDRKDITAIYAEVSIQDQLAAIEKILGQDNIIALLYSSSTQYLINEIRGRAERLLLTEMKEHESISDALRKIRTAKVLLAFPSREIYNKKNIKNILITTYRRNQSVFGYSRSFVKAGAIAAAFTTDSLVVKQYLEWAQQSKPTNHLPEPSYPKYYHIAVNEQVARSLGFHLRMVSEDEVFIRRDP